jgi:tRNA-dihydrouridine synthase B
MKIGSIDIKNPISLAPMEDVTDIPFRLICKRMGADIVYTEFTNCEAIVRNIYRAMDKIRVLDEERPVAIQLFGGNEKSMQEATEIASALKPDFIDINCGCWVKNVVARNEGAGLLRDLDKFKRIVEGVIKGTNLPVTVKTRLGWDEKSIVILEVAQMLEQLGVKALTVHCRTRSHAHNKAPADWSWLTKLKKVVSIPIIGNGDVVTPEDAKRMFETGCDGIMIGRGAINNPWIFEQVKHYLKTGNLLPEPTVTEKINLCVDHLQLAMEFKGEKNPIFPFRKFYSGYLKGLPNVALLRHDLMSLDEMNPIIDRLYEFLDQTLDVVPDQKI